jgi:hypothetical protein
MIINYNLRAFFLRNLYYLSQNGGNTGLISPFITRNTDSIWNSDRSGTANLGLYWTGPYDKTDASRQSSALDGLNCACY